MHGNLNAAVHTIAPSGTLSALIIPKKRSLVNQKAGCFSFFHGFSELFKNFSQEPRKGEHTGSEMQGAFWQPPVV